MGTLVHSVLSTKLRSPEKMKLKWPNDVLVDDKKVTLKDYFSLLARYLI